MTSLNRKTKWYIVVGLLTLLAAIYWVACGPSSTPVATPTAMPTSVPTQTPSPEPGDTPTPTPEPIPGILPNHTPSPMGDRDTRGEEQVVRGLVLENNLGCRVDVYCYLRLLSNGREVQVVYHYGEYPPCLNRQVVGQGLAMKKGDEVEVFGALTSDGEISTCDSEEYYIRKIQQ